MQAEVAEEAVEVVGHLDRPEEEGGEAYDKKGSGSFEIDFCPRPVRPTHPDNRKHHTRAPGETDQK